MKRHILLIEDHLDIAGIICRELEHEGYFVTWIFDGAEGLKSALENDYDLILLDIMLPSMNGLEILRRLTKQKNTPVIMLTARGQTVDKVTGLNLGAIDYVTKPFENVELLARIKAHLRKQSDAIFILTHGDLSVDLNGMSVSFGSEEISLTKKEYDLLVLLLKGKNKVQSRKTIVAKVWGDEYFGNTNLVDVYVRYLREKIEDRFGYKFIKTVRGSGYIIKD